MFATFTTTGALRIAQSLDWSLSDLRYLRKDANDTFNAGITTTWADVVASGAAIRVKSGLLQVKNNVDNLWYTVMNITPDGGVASITLSDTGEA